MTGKTIIFTSWVITAAIIQMEGISFLNKGISVITFLTLALLYFPIDRREKIKLRHLRANKDASSRREKLISNKE